MIEKKLLTLVCAVGVLGCGACGLLFREPPPPPPRMQLFIDVRTVRVEVFNHTATHGIDPAALKAAVIRQINLSRKRTPLRAIAEGEADCVLTLDVVEEEQYLAGASGERVDSEQDALEWQFHAVMSAALTGKMG